MKLFSDNPSYNALDSGFEQLLLEDSINSSKNIGQACSICLMSQLNCSDVGSCEVFIMMHELTMVSQNKI